MKIRRIVNEAGQDAVEIEPDRLVSVHMLWPKYSYETPWGYREPVYGAFARPDFETRVPALLDGQGPSVRSALLMLGEEGRWRDD